MLELLSPELKQTQDRMGVHERLQEKLSLSQLSKLYDKTQDKSLKQLISKRIEGRRGDYKLNELLSRARRKK